MSGEDPRLASDDSNDLEEILEAPLTESNGGGIDRRNEDDEIDWEEEIEAYRRRINAPKMSIYGEILGSVPVTKSHMIDATFESLDYDLGHSVVRKSVIGQPVPLKEFYLTTFLRWILLFLTGVLPALVAIGINQAIRIISHYKFRYLAHLIDYSYSYSTMVIPFVVWIGMNWAGAAIAGTLVAFVEPQAMGSGIPQIKAYLNGVNVPRLMRLKTLVVKAVGVIFSVLGGLAVGKEGPMIHSGAAIGAGISQGMSSSLGLDFISSSFLFKAFSEYRNDNEKRDFVACGAAAGVAAAFGAPFGGVLFALEEGNSHFDPLLMWKLTFASTTSYFTLNIINSFIDGEPGQIASGGLINFGKFKDADYNISTFPILLLFGFVGGVSGALYVQLNKYYTMVRLKYFQNRVVKVLDVMYIAGLTAALGSFMFLVWDDCIEINPEEPQSNHQVQLSCPGGQYHVMAVLWFATPEDCVKALLHDDPGKFALSTLVVFGVCYFFLAFATYGLSISSGVFVPSILLGCTWGRAMGIILKTYVTFWDWGDIGKFALFGAAAQLSGNVRMMVSLTLIMIESTGNLTYSFPLVIVCMVAKYTGDFFNDGLYETHTDLNGVPYLPWRPPPGAILTSARQIMSSPVQCFRMRNKLGTVIKALSSTCHNGFPVVDPPNPDDPIYPGSTKTFGKFRGIILRDQILTMLFFNKLENEEDEEDDNESEDRNLLTWAKLRSVYPRSPKLEDLCFSEEALENLTVDFRHVMNTAPYTVGANMSAEHVYRLFRLVGIRHLVVLNDSGEVVGMITRQNLAKLHGKQFKEIFVPRNVDEF